MEAGRQGAKLDYFEDNNLFNQVIGWVSGDGCMTATLQTQQDILSDQTVIRRWRLLAFQHSLCRAFQIHRKELNSGCKENERSSEALSSFKPHNILANLSIPLLYAVVLLD